MYIYVNGVAGTSSTTVPGGLNDTLTPVSIGSKRTGNDPNYDGTFNGTIDEVAVYNKALSADQVFADFGAHLARAVTAFIEFAEGFGEHCHGDHTLAARAKGAGRRNTCGAKSAMAIARRHVGVD